MVVDNFEFVKKNLLHYESKGEFFILFILRRNKDGNHESKGGMSPMLKYTQVYHPEYLDMKREEIMRLCRDNNARAYFVPQVRTTRSIVRAVGKKMWEIADMDEVNFTRTIRRAISGMKSSPRKRWILDLDADGESAWTEERVNALRDELKKVLEVETPEEKENVLVNNTPHGWHIITFPFRLDKYRVKLGLKKNEVLQNAATLLFADLATESDEWKEGGSSVLMSDLEKSGSEDLNEGESER